MAKDNAPVKVEFDGWPGGMNNVARETALQPIELRLIQNADPLPGGKYARRKGYTAISGAPGGHSAWSHPALNYGLYVDTSSNLLRISGTGAQTTLSTVALDRFMSYCLHNGKAYYSNGVDMGKINAAGTRSEWTIPPPPAPITAASATGGLQAGRYQVAYAPIDSSGEEHALSKVSTVVLTSKGAITLSPIPVLSGVDLAVYCSSLHAPNGEELRYLTTLASGTSSYTIGKENTLYHTPKRDHIAPMPSLYPIASFKRRIIGAQGRYLKFSEYQVSLIDNSHNWLDFIHPITAILPVEDGVFVGTERASFWCPGNDPEDFAKIQIDGVNGMASCPDAPQLPADLFPSENVPMQGQLTMWASRPNAEIILGRSGGGIQRLTHARLAIEEHRRARFAYWEHNGRRLVICTLYNPVGTQTRSAPDSS